MRACEQMGSENLNRFYNFFKMHAGQPPDAEVLLTMKGIKRKVYPHQLYAAFWMLWTERQGHGGGILGDEPGLGKVSQTDCLCVLIAVSNW